MNGHGWAPGLSPYTIDQRLVGHIIGGDLARNRLNAADARMIVDQRVAVPVHELVQAQPDAADQQATSILADAARRARVQSLLLMNTSNDIAAMLADGGIRALVYKGVALAAANGRPWLGRESSDVDVLIDPGDVEAAHELMRRHGLARLDGVRTAPNVLFRFHDIEMAYLGLPAVVDLHWRLETPGYLDTPFATLWANRRRIERDGLHVWTLGSTHTLLLSAVHSTRERWRSLRHMLDAGLQLSGLPQQDWRRVADDALACGAAKSLAVALGVADSCGVGALPATPGAWARRVADNFLADWSRRTREIQPPMSGTPLEALRRRGMRWRLAPDTPAALDSLTRASFRQVLHRRSWTITLPS